MLVYKLQVNNAPVVIILLNILENWLLNQPCHHFTRMTVIEKMNEVSTRTHNLIYLKTKLRFLLFVKNKKMKGVLYSKKSIQQAAYK